MDSSVLEFLYVPEPQAEKQHALLARFVISEISLCFFFLANVSAYVKEGSGSSTCFFFQWYGDLNEIEYAHRAACMF